MALQLPTTGQFGQVNNKESIALLALCKGGPSGTDSFPSQMVSNAEGISTSWRNHLSVITEKPINA